MTPNARNHQNRVKATAKQVDYLLVLLRRRGYPLTVDAGYRSLRATDEFFGRPALEFLRSRTVMQASALIRDLNSQFFGYRKPEN